MLLPIICFAFCVMPIYTLETKKTIITHILENNKDCTFPPKEILQKLSSCDRPKPDETSIDTGLDFGLYICLDLLEINKQLCGAKSNLKPINETQFNITFDKFQPNCTEMKQNLNSTLFKQSLQNITTPDEKFCSKYKSDYMIRLLIYGNKLKNDIESQDQLTKKNLKIDKHKFTNLKKSKETLQSQMDHKNEQANEMSKPHPENEQTIPKTLKTHPENEQTNEKISKTHENEQTIEKGSNNHLEIKQPIEKNLQNEKNQPKVKLQIDQQTSITTQSKVEEQQVAETKENIPVSVYNSIDNKEEAIEEEPPGLISDNENENQEVEETDKSLKSSTTQPHIDIDNNNFIENDNKNLNEDQDGNNFDSLDNNQQKLDTEDDERIINNKQEINPIYPYEDSNDSHFFTYFFSMIIFIIGAYLIFHNKQKIMALALEGRSKRMNRRRPSTASYRKLESNLEEAITSNCSQSVANVIY